MKQFSKLSLLLLALLLPATAKAIPKGPLPALKSGNISFADDDVKTLCVQNWDTDGDGELSIDEAAGVTSIGSVFNSNTTISSFDELQYFTGLTSCGESAFQGCTSLTSVTLPNSVTVIENAAFRGCSNLQNVTIPNSVTSIGDFAFRYCTSLTRINLPNSLTVIGQAAFYNCTELTNISLPNSVTTIDQTAFAYCRGLTSITIPDAVTTIGDYAFSWCNALTSVTIGNAVTTIGDCAFNNCSSLVSVTSLATTPPTIGGPYAFPSAVTSQATLYVPNGTVSAYQATDYWKNFFNITEIVILVTSLELDVTEAQLTTSETLQLTASILPENADLKTLSWSSSNEDVATVTTEGLVTAINPGTAMITATTNDGSNLCATCAITIIKSLSDYDDYLSMPDTTIFRGDTIVFPIAMNNFTDITGVQTDIFLPEGLELLKEDGEYLVEMSGRATRTHVIMSSDANNGSIRVLSYSSNGKAFTGNEGDLFYLTLKAADDAAGDYSIALRNTLFTTTDVVDFQVPDVTANVHVNAYVPGDANDSRTVTVSDIVTTAKYILDMDPYPFVFAAADMNADNSITVSDIVLISRLIIEEPTLNAPLHLPATDTTSDRMSAVGVSLISDKTLRVSIGLDNAMDYTAFQFDLMMLPAGLTASNFSLTDRASEHAFDVNTMSNGKTRVLCYSPTLKKINGNEGALLTFDVTAISEITGDIAIDDIEFTTATGQPVYLDAFTIGVNAVTSMNKLDAAKSVASVDYYNITGQLLQKPTNGVNIIVTTYSDGTRTVTKTVNK